MLRFGDTEIDIFERTMNLVHFQIVTNRASVVVVMALTYVINVPMDMN